MTVSRILVVAAALSAAACAHKKPVAVLQPPASPPAAEAAALVAAPAPVAPAVPSVTTCSGDDQCSSSQLCLSGACTAITPSLAACGITRVHFDFDRDLLHESEYPALQRAARCISTNRQAHVLITGNADERGTVEYNLALGERRADAVRRYLATLGVPAARLQEVTYGKEVPLCTEHDEACWQQNRRAAIRPGESPQDISSMVKQDEARERGSEGSAGGK